jgi:formamidopyrimidine-DNA glycosylase
MPELPEVESFRNYLEKHALNKVIKEAEAANPYMLQDVSKKELEAVLKGNAFVSTHRHGKFLFVKLKKGGYLMMHFGMTGYFESYEAGEKVPYFALLLTFPGGEKFAFVDRRKLGKVSLLEDVEAFIQKRGYGTDALKITQKQFLEALKPRRTAIKTALMAQNIIAGVGNEFSDEILFQAGIHPESKASALSQKQLILIFKEMQKILKKAVKADADRDKLREYFFLDNRKAGLPCPSRSPSADGQAGCKGRTVLKTIGGRSSYFCPSCQELIT